MKQTVRLALLLATAAWGSAAFAADAAVAGDAAGPGDEEIVVTGQASRDDAIAATKTATPIVETPQSISVLTNGDLAGLGLQNLNQALRFVAGVTPETRGASAEVYDQFKLRGFDAPIYLDGLKLFQSATGYAAPQVDVSRIDRIEIVKGPSSALYGQSGPGGLVVEDSKLPLDRSFYGAVSGTYGNYDLYRVDGDIGGKLSDTTLWRLYASANGAHDQQTYGRRERQTVSGAVTLGAGTRTSFTVLAAYSHDPRNGDYGVYPAEGTLLSDPAGKISTHFYGGEPGDFFSREQFGITYIFRHDLGGGWAFRTLGRYQYVGSQLGIVYTSGSPLAGDTTGTLFGRSSYATREKLDSFTYDNQLTGHVDTGPVHHSLLFGADRQVAHTYEDYAFGSGTTINAFDPVYGTMPTPRTPAEVPDAFGGEYHVQTRQQSVYGQDEISVAGLRLTLSGRHDWARQNQIGTGSKDDQKFTYRVGGLYLLPFGLAPYVSWSTSFEPQSNILTTGAIANPSLGKQLEAGVKYKVPGTEILLTGAWFDIKQSNVVVSDPVTFLAYQVGSVRSRGVEVEATAPLPYGFDAKLAFSRQRVKVLDDVDPARVGRSLATAGRGGISANLEWAPKSGTLEGFAVGGAVRHVDKTYADIGTDGLPHYTPDYTVFDALMRYDLGKLSPKLDKVQLALIATNIFDKKYLTSCFANYNWCWYGNRRTVQGTISFAW